MYGIRREPVCRLNSFLELKGTMRKKRLVKETVPVRVNLEPDIYAQLAPARAARRQSVFISRALRLVLILSKRKGVRFTVLPDKLHVVP